MHRLRTTWLQRGLAVLLAGSLLSISVGAAPQGASSAAAEAHADWLRAQVRVHLSNAEQDAFEAALTAAIDAAPGALHAFLQHFMAAYTQQDGGPSLAVLLGVTQGSHQHLINELQRRLAQLSGEAVIPRLATALHGTAVPSGARAGADAAVLNVPNILMSRHGLDVRTSLKVSGNTLVHILSLARPRAP